MPKSTKKSSPKSRSLKESTPKRLQKKSLPKQAAPNVSTPVEPKSNELTSSEVTNPPSNESSAIQSVPLIQKLTASIPTIQHYQAHGSKDESVTPDVRGLREPAKAEDHPAPDLENCKRLYDYIISKHKAITPQTMQASMKELTMAFITYKYSPNPPSKVLVEDEKKQSVKKSIKGKDASSRITKE